jgi:transposase-like protein
MESKIKCPHCGRETGQHEHGKNKSGTRRYFCYDCKKAYTSEPKKTVYTEEERSAAIKIYYENSSGRAVGRILGMSKANAVRWIKERTAKLPEPNAETAENTSEPVEVIELDELFIL